MDEDLIETVSELVGELAINGGLGHRGPLRDELEELAANIEGVPAASAGDPVDHPQHYTALGAACSACGHPIECIDVVERFGFLRGNAMKYLWRAGLKGDVVEDLKKARFYVQREIDNWTKEKS